MFICTTRVNIGEQKKFIMDLHVLCGGNICGWTLQAKSTISPAVNVEAKVLL